MNEQPISNVVDEHATSIPNDMTILDFDPVRDGFGFANVFTWTDDDLNVLASELGPLLKGAGIGIPALFGKAVGGKRGFFAGIIAGGVLSASKASDVLIHSIARRWRTFGLCGGMALLAKERWEASSNEPTSKLDRDALRPILRLRQAQTIRASWPRFLKYWLQALVTEDVFSPDELADEAARTQAEIDAGRLAIIGLVGDTPDPFSTHQVIAFGYEEGPNGTDFHVYDPNAPGRVRHVVVRQKGGQTILETDLLTGPKKNGGYHISKTAGSLSMMFVVDV